MCQPVWHSQNATVPFGTLPASQYVQAAFESMDHLAQESGISGTIAARSYLDSLELLSYDKTNFVRGAQTLAIMFKLAAHNINPDLSHSERLLYLKILLRRHDCITTSISDLPKPADVTPFYIRTFGTPCRSAAIRVSVPDCDLLRKEIDACAGVGIVRYSTSP